MRALVYYVACSVDGFIADAEGSIGAFGFEGPHVADLLAEFPETIPGHLREPLGVTAANRRFDTVVMGRATYEPALALGITSPYPHLRQLVVSRTLADVGDPAVEVVAADPVDVVRALRSEPGGDIWLAGGGRLAAALVDEIDELVLKINPLVLGEGVPLFDGPVGARALVGAGSRSYANGFVLARYRWARPGG